MPLKVLLPLAALKVAARQIQVKEQLQANHQQKVQKNLLQAGDNLRAEAVHAATQEEDNNQISLLETRSVERVFLLLNL